MASDYLEIVDRLVCGFYDYCPGVCAFSSLYRRVIADITPAEDRSTYLSRLNACGTAAYIVGPAIGGVLALVNNHFPLYMAGITSGIALVLAIFFLKESNPLVLQRREAKKNGAAGEQVAEKKAEKPLKKVKAHVSGTMMLCFCFDFCVRWTSNAIESRYGIYLSDTFNTPSIVYS